MDSLQIEYTHGELTDYLITMVSGLIAKAIYFRKTLFRQINWVMIAVIFPTLNNLKPFTARHDSSLKNNIWLIHFGTLKMNSTMTSDYIQ